MPLPLPLFLVFFFTVFPDTDIPTSFPSHLSVTSDRHDDVVLYEENITTSSCQGFSRLALPRSRTIDHSLHIYDFLEVQGRSPSAAFSISFSLCRGDGCLLSLLYFLYFPLPFLRPLVLTVLAFAIFFLYFSFPSFPSTFGVFFLFRPILRYTLSSFLTLLVGDVGIGVGPKDEGRRADTDTRVWEISVVEPGPGGKGGLVCCFLKTFSFDTMINRREV